MTDDLEPQHWIRKLHGARGPALKAAEKVETLVEQLKALDEQRVRCASVLAGALADAETLAHENWSEEEIAVAKRQTVNAQVVG
ncbi:hypothetical protein [Chenggangzhangella methanolivorans]|uniref:Uncharacterized protein n=1 Tax=Chenggangzhangella methanolivorans TaxID=1437009 RepID=A0A9E6RC93_9HYPH|nr:hypothetical protein [Chenggangzhangella methanolivorans]QZO00654.1 hypothetical protein K6K41_02765 [Chenggangzhangella methanolivorans]